MKYVKYNGTTDANLTNSEVYDVIEFKTGLKYIFFTIITDQCRTYSYTMWFDKHNSFEDITLEYARKEKITEILK